MTQNMSTDFSRQILGGRGYCRARVSANREIGKSASRERVRLTGRFALPNRQTPNEFGAQEKFIINHWLKPVAWAILEHSHPLMKQALLRPVTYFATVCYVLGW